MMADGTDNQESTPPAGEQRRTDDAEAALRCFAHDVCTPLANIKLAADLLDNAAGRMSEEALVELGANISSETDRLRWMFETIVEFSRLKMQGRKLRRHWHLAEDLTAAACRRLQRVREGCAVDVHVEPDMALIQGDEGLLVLALATLLDNAAQCSTASQAIEVRVTADQQRCLVEVYDAGPRLEDVGEVDEAVHCTGHASFTSPRNGGLGLLVSREIVEAHGGRLRVRNRPDAAGAVFSFTLDFGDEQPPQEVVAAHADHTAAT